MATKRKNSSAKGKSTKQRCMSKFSAEMRQGGLSHTQLAYRSGYLKACEHEANSFKYGAARYRGLTKDEAKIVANKKHPEEIMGVRRIYTDEQQ